MKLNVVKKCVSFDKDVVKKLELASEKKNISQSDILDDAILCWLELERVSASGGKALKFQPFIQNGIISQERKFEILKVLDDTVQKLHELSGGALDFSILSEISALFEEWAFSRQDAIDKKQEKFDEWTTIIEWTCL